jgi:hypothetical protein
LIEGNLMDIAAVLIHNVQDEREFVAVLV